MSDTPKLDYAWNIRVFGHSDQAGFQTAYHAQAGMPDT